MGFHPQQNFEKRVSVMKTIPKFLRGPFKNTLKLMLEEATTGEEVRVVRDWTLMLILPRMLLHRRPGGGIIVEASLVADSNCSHGDSGSS